MDYIAYIHCFGGVGGIPVEYVEPTSVGCDTVLRPFPVIQFLYRQEYLRQRPVIRLIDRQIVRIGESLRFGFTVCGIVCCFLLGYTAEQRYRHGLEFIREFLG